MKILILMLMAMPLFGTAQEKGNKGKLFFYFGLNWAAFTPSDVSFRGSGYDFELYNAKATNNQRLSNPQYNYRLGYYVTDKIAFSAGLDHMKYILTEDQRIRIKGRIDSASSKTFAGQYDKEIVLTDDFLHLEHTDGLNYVSAEMEYTHTIPLKNNVSVDLMAGPGFGLMIPRTDATVFGRRVNNKYHLSGWGASLKSSSRLNFLQHFFTQGEVKTGFVHLSDILLTGESGDRAKQAFGFLEGSVLLGCSYRFGR